MGSVTRAAGGPKRRDKQYRKELAATVDAFNANGKKTVLMTCDTFFPVVDGVINVLDSYARLAYGAVNVLVLVPAFKGRAIGREYPTLCVKSVYSARLHYQIALPGLDRFCHKLLKKLRIDLIHCHSPFFIGRYVLRLHKRRNIPMVTTFHSQYKRDFERYVGSGPISRFLLRFIMKVFDGSDEVWTMHASSRETLRSYGYRGKVRLLPNGTSFSPPADYAAERAAARKRYGAGDRPVLLFLGRLIAQKNIFFLAGVLGELKRRGLDFLMLFVGEGPDRGKLENLLRAEGVLENTLFAGRIDGEAERCAVYAAADLFLFPSLYDVSSIVQIEAASRYTPAVFVENSVTSCTVTDGRNGYIFPCDKTAYADGILGALSDRETREKIGENAFRELYITWDDVIKTALSRYEELTSPRPE